MVIKPVTSHAAISNAGEFTSRDISEDTMKIPEPIIEPITSMVALVRPRPLTNSLSCRLWISQSLAIGADGLVMLKGLLRFTWGQPPPAGRPGENSAAAMTLS